MAANGAGFSVIMRNSFLESDSGTINTSLRQYGAAKKTVRPIRGKNPRRNKLWSNQP
jgi:hypothetical protein